MNHAITNHILDISHSSFGSSFSSNTLKGIEKPKKKHRAHKNLETKENNNLPLNKINPKNKKKKKQTNKQTQVHKK